MPRRPVSVLAALALTVLAILAVGASATARAADVWGDDERDRYVGVGGLILPGSIDQGTRQEVAACADCHWRLTSPCVASDLGHPFDGQPACTSVVRGCPGGELLRSWFQPAGGAWRETGLICLRDGAPRTVSAVGGAVADRVERLLPPLDPRAQPTTGALTQLPVLFRSGQPGTVRHFDMRVLGEAVGISATPAWLWHFGDGARLATDDPGGTFPDGRVTHVYRASGGFRVDCSARWTATFTVDGLGPFPVSRPLRQDAVVRVEVGEGRALLATAG